MCKPLSDAKDNLITKVNSVGTAGSTNLGPGVIASVAMASKGAPGSQVIVLTDGMANGGAINSAATYEKIGLFA